MNIEESQRRFMQWCENYNKPFVMDDKRPIHIEQPPSRRDWLETAALLVIGFAAGYVYSLI